MLDLGGPLSDLEGKNSKFRRITFLRMVTKNISMRFQHSPIKTVGGVRKSTKKCTKMTSLSPAPVEPLFGRPRDLCPEVTFSKMHIHMRFRDDRTSGKWSKRPDRRTDEQTLGRKSALLYLRRRWPQIKIVWCFHQSWLLCYQYWYHQELHILILPC